MSRSTPIGAGGAVTFLPGGTLANFNYGSFTSSSFQSGGDGPRVNLGFAPDQRRYNGFLRGEFDASERVKLYAEGTYAYSHTNLGAFVNQYVGSANAFTIFRDNAFLPTALGTLMDTNRLRSAKTGARRASAVEKAPDTMTVKSPTGGRR